MEYKELIACIDACLECATRCDQCAVSSLKEKELARMRTSIRLNMECATICYAAAELMSMSSYRSSDICRLCEEVCEACAAECEKHDTAACRACAIACKACAEECRIISGLPLEV